MPDIKNISIYDADSRVVQRQEFNDLIEVVGLSKVERERRNRGALRLESKAQAAALESARSHTFRH